MADALPDPIAQAIAWRLRLQNGSDADWQAFVGWLEADPMHSDAYDAVEAADSAMDADAFLSLSPTRLPPPANDETPHVKASQRKWLAGLAAVAATAILAALTYPMLNPRPDRYEVASAAGEQRRVDIGNASFAMLNGETRLILDRNDRRSVELVGGEATFSVRHDANHPFTVVSGEHQVQDLGTTFNVIRERGDFSVEVIDGAVIYNPGDEAISLDAGQALRVSGDGRPVVVRTDPQTIAGWRRGQLSYVNAPMSRVANDLSRTLGAPITVHPDAANVPFTGSIRIGPDVSETIGDLALAAGVRAHRDQGGGWIIEPLARAPR